MRAPLRRVRSDPSQRRPDRGQSLVEFAMVVPVFMLLLLGMLEFGFVFDQTMTLSYGTREGARTAAALGPGNTTTLPCTTSDDIDKHIIAAVERVLEGPGSRITLAPSTQVVIYRATTSGTSTGQENIWVYSPGGGPSVDGQALDFARTGGVGYNACTRDADGSVASPPDSVGVSVRYIYQFVTPLGAAMRFFGPSGASSLLISDRTVMALNPTVD